jgi:hypothetical protein
MTSSAGTLVLKAVALCAGACEMHCHLSVLTRTRKQDGVPRPWGSPGPTDPKRDFPWSVWRHHVHLCPLPHNHSCFISYPSSSVLWIIQDRNRSDHLVWFLNKVLCTTGWRKSWWLWSETCRNWQLGNCPNLGLLFGHIVTPVIAPSAWPSTERVKVYFKSGK